MKKLFKDYLIISLLLYLLISFVTLELDFRNWTHDVRFLYVLIYVSISTFITLIDNFTD